ncbi:hypothetical protein QJS10_CPB15g01550 [Acorus calamus]|uniref:Uncharacterized protein n=1 Tax=Acorus calamus TaxID=4465 RepID=A0AAV9D9F3_ACOCL|nr:hypothetical protein QJS10_CPB15g01550 [Acorus calamus]
MEWAQSPTQIIVYDFQPQNPEDVWVAIAALSSQSVPGVVLERNLKRLPSKSCWFVGLLRPEGLEVAKEFNRRWPTDLKIGHHDCRHYADGLVECLTGQQNMLARLRGI